MNHYMKLLSVLSTGTLLGCSQLSLAPAQRDAASARTSVLSRVQPVERISSPGHDVEHLWLQGRAAQSQGQLALAEDHYARILKGQSAHPGALSAMAVIYAQTDRLDLAIGLFRQVLALQPQASHAYNNLGYALLLAGRLGEAERALDRASVLNPSSALTQKNKELLAQAKERGATLLTSPAAKTDLPPMPIERGLVAVAPNIYELRDPLSASAASLPIRAETTVRTSVTNAMSESRSTSVVLRGVRLEVSNGMGVRHMARRTAERLMPLGLATVRLTNQPGYKQIKTELQFNADDKNAAQALAQQLPQMPLMTSAHRLHGHVQLRLVLGHDQVGKAVANWLDAPEVPIAEMPEEVPQPVALNPQQGWRWS